MILNSDLIRAEVLNQEFHLLNSGAIKDWLLNQDLLSQRDIEVTIYSSESFIKERDTGFDGTAIHFYSPSASINELYTIFRGSEHREVSDWRPKDWVYNLLGIFTGLGKTQYEAARAFNEEVTNHILNQTIPPLRKIGMGFSLGGNLVQTLQLIEAPFEIVFTYNDAKPSVYQLAYIDTTFQHEIELHTNQVLDPFSLIYQIPIEDLEKLAHRIYPTEKEFIYKLNVNSDLLYAFHIVPGFMDVGHECLLRVRKEQRLREVLEDIPPTFFRTIREGLATYSLLYETEGFDALWEEITGLDAKTIEAIFRSIVDYREDGFHPGLLKEWWKIYTHLFGSIDELYNRLPLFTTLLSRVWEHAPTFLRLLMSNNYLTVEEYKQWNESLTVIRGHMGGDLDHGILEQDLWLSLLTSFRLLKKVMILLFEDVVAGVQAHDLDSLIYYIRKYDKIFL